MDISRRKCLREDEKTLRFFPVYTEANCILECAWNVAGNNCGCVPWFLKRYYPGKPLCEITGNECFRGETFIRWENIFWEIDNRM
jgi:hypothetical protein